jgi:mono/diheme cytochrome c family protein
MKPLTTKNPLGRVCAWLAVMMLALGAASLTLVRADDTKSTDTKAPASAPKLADAKLADAKTADAKPADSKAAAPKADTSTAKKTTKKLSGQELYQIHCNRCHAERYATEFSPNQWKTLMTHMRVRANLPASQAKQVLKYLQEDAGTP